MYTCVVVLAPVRHPSSVQRHPSGAGSSEHNFTTGGRSDTAAAPDKPFHEGYFYA